MLITGKGIYSLVVRSAAAAGIGFSLLGIGSGIYYPHFRKHALRTTGIIKKLSEHEDDGNVYICPEYSFRTLSGNGYTVNSGNCSNPSEFSVGQTVAVLYKPDDPTDAFIDSPGQFSRVPSWELETGAITSLIAFILFWLGKRVGIRIRWLGGWSSLGDDQKG